MRIAIIGIGNVGLALGGALAAAGHSITFGVRDPSSEDVRRAADLGGAAHTVADAAAQAQVVLLAVPWAAMESAVAACGDLDGKILIDATNPLAWSADTGLRLALGFDTSGAERVAALAPGAKVFKAFNQTGAENMAAATNFPVPPVMFVAGDDAQAKLIVLKIVADAGFEAIDGGPLAAARLLEPLAMLWIQLALARGLGRSFALALTHRPDPADAHEGKPAR